MTIHSFWIVQVDIRGLDRRWIDAGQLKPVFLECAALCTTRQGRGSSCCSAVPIPCRWYLPQTRIAKTGIAGIYLAGRL